MNAITFAKSVLRRASHRMPAHINALKHAKQYRKTRNKDGSISKRRKVVYKCAQCRKYYTKRDVHVDHIEPIGLYKDFEDWVIALIEGKRQVLCAECHRKKTKLDKKRIRKHGKM